MSRFKIKDLSVWDKTLLIICVFLLFTQLRALFPLINGMIVMLVGCLIVAYFSKDLFKEKAFIWLLPYFLVVFMNYISGDLYFDSYGDVFQEVAFLFFASSITYYSFRKTKVFFSNVLISLVLLIIIYYSISSLLIEQTSPGIIRETVYMSNLGETKELQLLYLQGLINYQLPHALPILIPPLVMNVREKNNKKYRKMFCLFALVSIAIIVYISNAATALFLSSLILLLSLVVRNDSMKNNATRLFLTMIVAIPLLYNADVILEPLMRLFSSTDDSLYYDKIESLLKSSESGTATGSLASREAKYDITLTQIGENFLLGTNENTGGHSALIDRLACLGIVGWIPYLCFLYYQIIITRKYINRNSLAYYYLGLTAAIIMLVSKNMSNWETWFMALTILPLMIWLPNQKNLKKSKKV